MGVAFPKFTFKTILKVELGLALLCVALGILYVFTVVRELKLKLSAYEIRPEEAQKNDFLAWRRAAIPGLTLFMSIAISLKNRFLWRSS